MDFKISVIVPVYNLADYLPACLDSLIGQTYRNLEILVVDDGSNDASWSIIQAYADNDSRIVPLHKTNGGAASARNWALERMTGDLLTFVDGDDRLASDTLECLVGKFEEDALDWVEFPVVRVNAAGELLESAKDYGCFMPDAEEEFTREHFMAYFKAHRLSELACACLYRTASVGHLRFPEHYYYEDSFYFTDVLCATGKGALSTLGSYQYVERANSSQLTTLTRKRLESKVACFLDRRAKFSQVSPSMELFFEKHCSDMNDYLRIQAAKRVEGAEEVLRLFQSKVKFTSCWNWKKELQIALYRMIGYQNLVKMRNAWMK